jgi:hypothetical protein
MAEQSTSRPALPDDASDQWRRARQEEVLRLTSPAQRLAWLEEAIAFARRAGALPRAHGSSSP